VYALKVLDIQEMVGILDKRFNGVDKSSC